MPVIKTLDLLDEYLVEAARLQAGFSKIYLAGLRFKLNHGNEWFYDENIVTFNRANEPASTARHRITAKCDGNSQEKESQTLLFSKTVQAEQIRNALVVLLNREIPHLARLKRNLLALLSENSECD